MNISDNCTLRQEMIIRIIKNYVGVRIFINKGCKLAMRISGHITVLILCFLFLSPVLALGTVHNASPHPIENLVGERLEYDISFLWFDHLAEGSLELVAGETEGTYLATLEAKTLGVAAFVTRKRVAKYQTLMVIGDDGILAPVWHSSHAIRGEGDSRKEKVATYSFDFKGEKVRYQKQKNSRAYSDKWYDLEPGKAVYDILTALYNLRLGLLGAADQKRILIPTFHHKGPQDIVIESIDLTQFKDRSFFSGDYIVSKILVDPSVFGTKGRDIYASFDRKNRPTRGIIKNVIGLGDVKGTLRSYK